MKRAIQNILFISLSCAGTYTPLVAAPDPTRQARPQVPVQGNPQAGTTRGDQAGRSIELLPPADSDPASPAGFGSRLLILEAEEIEAAEEANIAVFNPVTGAETFESGFPDSYWSVGDLNGGNGFDYWDDVNCNSLSGAFSAWCAGVGNQADCSLYDDDMDAFMCVEAEYTGSSHNGTDRFYFSLWNEVEACCDYAWISIAAFDHEPLHGIGVCDPDLVGRVTFHSTSECSESCECHHGRCWRDVRVSLGPDFNAFSFLRICFRFHSDESVRHEGAYFDDIRFNGLPDTSIFPILGGFDGDSCIGDSGCTTNSHCDTGEFCKRDDGDCGEQGDCFPKPVSCSGTIAQVCGCNGQTYDNRCRANQAGVNVAHLGACDSGCTTNSHCDTGEFCKRDDGACGEQGDCFPKPVSCSGTIAQVCGCNGQTYDNRCRANQVGVNVAHLGPCATCAGGPFTIGGVVYSDCGNPLTTGIEDVTIEVTCGPSMFEATTSGSQGLWQIPNVPCGTCTVCPDQPGNTFQHVGPSCQLEGPCHIITVNQANQGPNQSIQFVGTESCTLFDLNNDGFPSIVGDVPLAVDCIYHDDCNCPEEGCVCPADCNCDGFLSIIGDVPCLVDCYYDGNCDDECVGVADAATAAGGFTIGGAIYTDINSPISSGLPEVSVAIACEGALNRTAITSGAQGLWFFGSLPNGTCRITPVRTGFCFELVEQGTPTGQPFFVISVDAAHQQQNQSIQFLARTNCPPAALGACCLGNTCVMAEAENCGGQFLGGQVSCSADPDEDAVAGCADVCPVSPAPAGVDNTGRPLGDLTGDCMVALDDFQILQNNMGGPLSAAPPEIDELPRDGMGGAPQDFHSTLGSSKDAQPDRQGPKLGVIPIPR